MPGKIPLPTPKAPATAPIPAPRPTLPVAAPINAPHPAPAAAFLKVLFPPEISLDPPRNKEGPSSFLKKGIFKSD